MASTSVTAGWLMSADSAADGETDLARAFARYGPSLHRYFAVRTGADAHEADDLMQRLWMRAKNGATSVPAGEIEYWLKAVAKNLIREHWRKQTAIPRHVPIADPGLAAELADRIADEQLPDECWQRREVRDQLILAVTELAGHEQEVIVGFYFQEASLASLAARLGISERAVEGRLRRARRALRQKLRNLEA
jgi:RNA polymerase sigma-70 factor (ECF subfamily)